MKRTKLTGALALSTAALFGLAGCAGDGGSGDNGAPEGPISISFVSGWTDGQSLAYLLEDQLQKLGYETEMQELADNGPVYGGLSEGDIDIAASAWPEVTQASFWDEFGDSIEDLATWYDGAVLTIAVPSYSAITSLDELKDNADLFNGEIVGIEPGAGLTGVTEDSMMPAYELEEEFSLLTSSTAAMLTVLGEAIANEEEVVVTLWRPFWAYNEYDVRDLEDPLGAMGEPEGLHILARDGFTADYADIVELIAEIKLSDEAYGELEGLVTSEEYEGDSAAAIDEWISQNSDAFPTLLTE